MSDDLSRVDVTDEARQLIRQLKEQHGELLFHQSGGCCDGSAPMCYPHDDFKIGQRDVYLGEVEGCPFYIGGQQFEKWKHTHLTLDVVPGRGAGFSLEAPEGKRFLIRSRVFSDEELQQLGEPHRGPIRP
ncbi:DUF779 domain-containing protein [Persicimonas caeni]|jgi:hypothetical protein|uniref:DUF779 domain-containing protein n=1 Tax=Persicimonas caeni TaxID=2292766 RepID=A0A4Y6PNY0_PERCE|nr:DUF779 domain-containing protein [Persicimonas caeni]QDG50041.1 DUF779 domain-containing protein [Persicimonas caeni]QED31262.1 DUF779 domain-containing protein [Persicimonas caeni]